jgi:hypothetical protein
MDNVASVDDVEVTDIHGTQARLMRGYRGAREFVMRPFASGLRWAVLMYILAIS